jgi:hypothetical protein
MGILHRIAARQVAPLALTLGARWSCGGRGSAGPAARPVRAVINGEGIGHVTLVLSGLLTVDQLAR